MTDQEIRNVIADTERAINSLYDQQREYKEKHPVYRELHVFDENKSVKWNREEAQRQNELRQKELYRYQKKISAQYSNLHDAFMEYIKDEYGLSEEAAKLVYNAAYEDGHHAGYYEVLTYIATYADFANNIIKTIK